MKLIDADALLEKAWDAENGFGWEKVVSIKDIANSTTIDAIPVIRCRDCKWYERSRLKKDGTDDMRYVRDFCTWHRIWSPAEYFCADGERRENEAALQD